MLAGVVEDIVSANQSDYKVLRLSSDGSIIWTKRFGGTGQDGLTDIITTDDGRYVIGGNSDTNANGDKSGASLGGGIRDYWILKLNADGTKVWDRTIGGQGGESFLGKISQTADGGYVLGGHSSADAGRSKTENNKGGLSYRTSDFWIVKLNGQRNRIWDKTVGGDGSENFSYVEQTSDGGYFLVGSSFSNTSDDKSENSKTGKEFTEDGWVVKLDAAAFTELLSLSLDSLTFISGPTNQTAAQTVTLSATSDTPKLNILKSENTNWLTLPQPEIGDLSFDINASELDSGTYVSAVTIYAPGYGRVVMKVKLMVSGQPPLPVTLISFTAQKEANMALLTWKTASETRSNRFEVEHSQNGKAWSSIEALRTKGESHALQTYEFTHRNPINGDNFYRLKIVDTDGSFTYSKIEHVKFEIGLEVSVYPNPAAENIHLQAADWSKVKDVQI